jgi:hypothetical protein
MPSIPYDFSIFAPSEKVFGGLAARAGHGETVPYEKRLDV